jgi:hypothetical protein
MLSNYFVKPVKNKAGYSPITTTVDDLVPICDSRSGDYSFDYEQLAVSHPELLYNVNDNEKAIKFCEIIPVLVKEIQELKRLIKGDKKVAPVPPPPSPISIPVLIREPISEIYEMEPAENKPMDMLIFEPVFKR